MGQTHSSLTGFFVPHSIQKLPSFKLAQSGQTRLLPEFVFTSGTEFPIDLHEYKLIIHCGGCMLNEREIMYRSKCAFLQKIPMTNYGIAIAYMNGILKRTVAPLPEIKEILE